MYDVHFTRAVSLYYIMLMFLSDVHHLTNLDYPFCLWLHFGLFTRTTFLFSFNLIPTIHGVELNNMYLPLEFLLGSYRPAAILPSIHLTQLPFYMSTWCLPSQNNCIKPTVWSVQYERESILYLIFPFSCLVISSSFLKFLWKWTKSKVSSQFGKIGHIVLEQNFGT